MKNLIQMILVVILALTACTKEELDDIGVVEEEVITSTSVNDDFQIRYFLPPDYSADKQYAAIYLLDGDFYFESMTGKLIELWERNSIPECILIGIGNSENRARDYTYPYSSSVPGSGGGDDFYRFLTQELVPHVDNCYTTDTSMRVLTGHSFGGFFALYSMFQYNDTDLCPFRYYVAASPSLYWSNGYLFELEETQAKNTNIMPFKLYMSVGGDEAAGMAIFMEEMVDRLDSRDYEDFRVTTEIHQGKSHNEASIPGLVSGLKFVFNN